VPAVVSSRSAQFGRYARADGQAERRDYRNGRLKANFVKGVVLEYFSSTHGARKGLAAQRPSRQRHSGYITRKLARHSPRIWSSHRTTAATTHGITRGVVYRGEKVEVSLADAIRGRVSRTNIVNPITDDVVIRERRTDYGRYRPPHRKPGAVSESRSAAR